HRTLGLFSQVGGTAVPELGHVEHRVQHRGRVARPMLPAVTDRGGDVVGAARTHAVAGITGDDVALRQARLEPQPLTEFDLFRGEALLLDDDVGGGNWLEQIVRQAAQLFDVYRAGHGRRAQGEG